MLAILFTFLSELPKPCFGYVYFQIENNYYIDSTESSLLWVDSKNILEDIRKC